MFRKSIIFTTVLALSLSMTGCGSLLGNTSNNNSNAGGMFGVLSSILGGGSGGGLLGNVLGSVISNGMGLGFVDNVVGHSTIDKASLEGIWIYAEPGCAFTSQSLAGSELAVKQKLSSAFNTLGIKSENTGFVFDQKGNFEALIKGLPLKGTYTFDPNSGKLNLNSSIGTIPAYVTASSKGLAITLESKNLAGMLQSLKISGGNALSAINNLGNSYNGARFGFDLVKYNKQ